MKIKQIRYLFYGLWLAFAALQAVFTELFDDEAYYWMFSKNMAWGYFDHPPAIALLIRLGTSLFGHSEFSVRFFIILLNIATVFLIEKLTKPQNQLLFYALISSMVFLHIGFLAIPDAPLFFFVALFYFALSSYIEKENVVNSILLLISMSLMMYSKYHGILVIGFSLAAHPKLLIRKSFIFITIGSLLLYFPHLMWLNTNDFITLKYHLFERTLANKSDPNVSDFLLGLPFCLSGLSSCILMYYCYKFKPTSDMDRIYKLNFFAPIIFFFIMSFKGRVEVNWISISIIPMIVILFKQINEIKSIKLIYTLSVISLFFIVVIRLFLVFDFAPKNIDFSFEFRNQKKWTNDIKSKAGPLPVIFTNSYAEAAKYEFYTYSPSFSLNSIMGRKNQYTISSEKELLNKTVFLINNYAPECLDTFLVNNKTTHYKIIPNFNVYSNLKLKPVNAFSELPGNTEVNCSVLLENTFYPFVDLEANKDYPSYFVYSYFKDGKLVSKNITTIKLTNDMIGKTFNALIHTPEKEGKYILRFSLKAGWLPPTINSEFIKVKVK